MQAEGDLFRSAISYLHLGVLVYSEPLILRDGQKVEIGGKRYNVTMDYNPERTEIRGVRLDAEE